MTNSFNFMVCLTRLLRVLILVVSAGASVATAQICAAPGITGPVTLTGNSVINTYYAGGAATAGTSALTLGSASPRAGGGPVLAAGDLILIIQMQDGTGLDTSNTAAYGGGGGTAGRYEFARVASVAGTAVALTANLTNSYTQNTAVANNQTFQVIRVPQYATLVNNGNIVPLPWDGSTGGVVVMDVSGTFTNNGAVDTSYAGFRGNAGLTLGGAAGAAAVPPYQFVQPDTYTAHGGKGEGIAGTPNRVLQVFASPGVLQTGAGTTANGTATNATTSGTLLSTTGLLVNTARSYNGGSRAGGAPGNAGGGANDSNPAANDENAGGGGGGSWGSGGKGGNSWNDNALVGGQGGAGATGSAVPSWTPTISLLPAPGLAGRLIMGGGGGSGTTNNGFELNSSGGAGGGLILIKAQNFAGTGSLLANGQAGRSNPLGDGTNGTFANQCPANGPSSCDGGGGGGAGGGVVVLGASGNVNISAAGAQGGNINGTIHGPGGGGGGGYVVRSTGVALGSSNLVGGIAGLANVGDTASAYGAEAGIAGAAAVVAAPPAVAGGLPQNCLPALTTSKVTAIPASSASIVPPGTTTYSIVVSNAAGRGDALGVNLWDPALPSAMNVANPPAPTFSFSATPSVCTLGTRTAVANPPNGATTPVTANSFSIPGGCTLTFTFTINVPTTVPDGTYNNSAVAFFRDPTDSSGTRTVTSAGFNGGIPSPNTSFTLGGAVGGLNYDGSLASNSGEDIRVQRMQIFKAVTLTSDVTPTGTVSPGDTITWSIFVRNPGTTSVALQVSDTLPSGLNFVAGSHSISSTAGTCDALAGPPGARNPAFNGVGVTNMIIAGQSIPGGCTIRIDVPMQIPSNTTLTSTTNTSVVSGTTSLGATPAVTSSNLDTPSGVASAIPGLGAGAYPSGPNITQPGAILGTPTLATILQSVNLIVTKTNGVNAPSTLIAGSTTVYTVTVSNLGPSVANNAILRDPAAPGLSCTAVACTGGTGGAVCPAPATVTILNLQGVTGVPVTLPANSTLNFSVTCGVTARGS